MDGILAIHGDPIYCNGHVAGDHHTHAVLVLLRVDVGHHEHNEHGLPLRANGWVLSRRLRFASSQSLDPVDGYLVERMQAAAQCCPASPPMLVALGPHWQRLVSLEEMFSG